MFVSLSLVSFDSEIILFQEKQKKVGYSCEIFQGWL